MDRRTELNGLDQGRPSQSAQTQPGIWISLVLLCYTNNIKRLPIRISTIQRPSVRPSSKTPHGCTVPVSRFHRPTGHHSTTIQTSLGSRNRMNIRLSQAAWPVPVNISVPCECLRDGKEMRRYCNQIVARNISAADCIFEMLRCIILCRVEGR